MVPLALSNTPSRVVGGHFDPGGLIARRTSDMK